MSSDLSGGDGSTGGVNDQTAMSSRDLDGERVRDISLVSSSYKQERMDPRERQRQLAERKRKRQSNSNSSNDSDAMTFFEIVDDFFSLATLFRG